MKTIVVFSPHNDDLEIGLGGTILKHIDEGYKIIKLVFSAGQLSNPHLKEEVIVKRRERDALAVARAYNIHNTIFYRLTDQKLKKELASIEEDVRAILRSEQPEKVYMPSSNDAHADHRAVFQFGFELLKESPVEIYSYEVWNVTQDNYPVVYVDITDYFKKKVDMLHYFTTEKVSTCLHRIPLMYREKKYGRKIGVKYADKFYKIQ